MQKNLTEKVEKVVEDAQKESLVIDTLPSIEFK